MSIRPVDYQILMPKVNEMARLQNEEQQKLMGQIQQKAESSVRQANRDTESVHSQKEAQKTVITEKQKEKNGQQRQQKEQRNGKQEKESDAKALEPKLQKHSIDIRL